MRRLILVSMMTLLCIASFFGQSRPASTATPLQGVWRVAEVTSTGPNGATNRNPQPGLIIFTARHYSMMLVTSTSARPDLAQDAIAAATANQLRATWDPFTANSGAYEVSGSTVTFRQMVAKMPYVMASGNFSTSSFKIEGNTLTLVTSGGRAGSVTNPTTTKLTRVE